MFVFGDLGAFFLPFRIFRAEHLAHGITPLWMPNLFCGFYAHGEGQIGIFHPLRWLLYRLLPLSEAFNLECILPYPLALIGVALFLRRLALPASAAIFGGATFALSGYLTARLTHLNAIAVVAHLGWLLFAIDLLLRGSGRARWRAWIGIALVTGSQLLVGYPAAVAYCWLIAIPYAVFIAVSDRRVGPLLAVGGAFAVGILLAGIQLVPTYEYLAASLRAQSTYDFLTEQSLHPVNLFTIAGPWLFRRYLFMEQTYNPVEQVCHLGAVAPIAALWMLLRWRQLGALRPLVAGLFGLSALALVLALGRHTGLYRYFLELPLVGSLRVPARYVIALFFSGAVFAAIAFADLQRAESTAELRRRARWIWIVPGVSACVAGAALAMIRNPEWGPDLASQLNAPGWIAVGPLVFVLAAALFTFAARGHRTALYGLLVLTPAEHAIYAVPWWWSNPPRTIAEYRAGIPRTEVSPPFRIATTSDWGWAGPPLRWWGSTRLIVRDARLVSGYAGLIPAKQLDYATAAARRVTGAALLLEPPRLVTSLSGALSRARLVTRAVLSAQPAIDIEAIDVANAALVEEPIDLEVGPAGTAAIEEERAGALQIQVEAPTRQLLVLAESFHPGWQVLVDGAAARVLRVNGDFMGVLVDPGVHAVHFSFAPRSFVVGRWTSLAGIGIVLAVALAGLLGGSARGA